MTLRMRILLITASACAAVALLMGGLLARSMAVDERVDRVIIRYEPAADDAALLAIAISEMRRGLDAFLASGRAADLQPFVNGERDSGLALQALSRLLRENPAATELIAASIHDRGAWLEEVARPAISARRTGDADAEGGTASEESPTLRNLEEHVRALVLLIGSERRSAFESVIGLTQAYAVGTGLALLLLLAGAAGIWALISMWVTIPLDRLREQLRSAAQPGNHALPIVPTGPPELRAAGRDAESMRQQLVAEIDQAASARAALSQEAPVVAAIEQELKSAKAPRVPGLRIHGLLHSAEGVLAGDWWDALDLGDGRVAVLLTDVSGHGPAAGVAAMRIKHTLDIGLRSGQRPGSAVAAGASAFDADPGRFATTVVLLADTLSGHLSWVNAGHHPPLLLRADGSIKELRQTGPLLSWLGGSWTEEVVEVLPGDRVLLFSDGLLEARDENGTEFGADTVRRLLAGAGGGPTDPADLVSWLVGHIRARAVDWDRDDVTVVALLVTEDFARAEPALFDAEKPQTRA